jgi:hypothetical protein
MQSYVMISIIIIQKIIPSEILTPPIINKVNAYLQSMTRESEKNPRANVAGSSPLPSELFSPEFCLKSRSS